MYVVFHALKLYVLFSLNDNIKKNIKNAQHIVCPLEFELQTIDLPGGGYV